MGCPNGLAKCKQIWKPQCKVRVIVRKPAIILIKKGHQSINDESKRKDRKTSAQKPVTRQLKTFMKRNMIFYRNEDDDRVLDDA